MALQLYNTVEMVPDDSGTTTVHTSGEGARILEKNGSRLVAEAARRVFHAAGFEPGGLSIRQHNRIPLFRGLGSSAAAIAGGMAAANRLLPQPLPGERIVQLAAEMEGHPDNVTPALLGGITVACYDAGRIHYVRIEPPPALRLVVAVPAFALPTRKSRSALPAEVPLADAVFNIGQTALLVAALCRGDLDALAGAMGDRLHQPYRKALIPGLDDVFAAARQAGALAVAVSGAGPALVAFVRENDDEVGEEMRRAFARHGVTCRIIQTGVGARGALDNTHI
jgi:homoserine kinase